MASTAGAFAQLADTVASWFLDPAGYEAYQRRAALAAKRKEVQRALDENRWADVRRLSGELLHLSNKP